MKLAVFMIGLYLGCILLMLMTAHRPVLPVPPACPYADGSKAHPFIFEQPCTLPELLKDKLRGQIRV